MVSLPPMLMKINIEPILKGILDSMKTQPVDIESIYESVINDFDFKAIWEALCDSLKESRKTLKSLASLLFIECYNCIAGVISLFRAQLVNLIKVIHFHSDLVSIAHTY